MRRAKQTKISHTFEICQHFCRITKKITIFASHFAVGAHVKASQQKANFMSSRRRRSPTASTPKLAPRWRLTNESITVNRNRTLGSGNFAVVHEGAFF